MILLYRKFRKSKNYRQGFIGFSEDTKTIIGALPEFPKKQYQLSGLFRNFRRSKNYRRGFIGFSEEAKSSRIHLLSRKVKQIHQDSIHFLGM